MANKTFSEFAAKNTNIVNDLKTLLTTSIKPMNVEEFDRVLNSRNESYENKCRECFQLMLNENIVTLVNGVYVLNETSNNDLKYYMDQLEENEKPSANNIFVAIEEFTHKGMNRVSIYSPTEQHNEVYKSYVVDACKEISKEEYLNLSSNFYTPKEYI